jgi:cobaltochelatase CobN
VLPVFVYSLKDVVSKGIIEASSTMCTKPDVVINTTGFAVSAPGADRSRPCLKLPMRVVLQAIFSGSSRSRVGSLVAGADRRAISA